ncbi:chitin deacetylase 7-like [Pectinophora gossypiella]|uniref:chitin deacetylase 7-like n=1 Tax=Pectinophora gossypiella TaxID=13191 RepID=UPI00214E15E5|nr:chitin deacetylase 7-like [Pectinophora gossypiella]
MKWLGLISLLLVVLVSSAPTDDEVVLPLAEPCDLEACQLPDCRCSTTDIPGGLAARDTPQFVVMTFDGPVDEYSLQDFNKYLGGRTNMNGCPVGATFYINHGSTNYEVVNQMYNQGFEIGLKSISHNPNHEYWAEGTVEEMRKEFGDQRITMSHFANIPIEDIKGIRIPYLQMAGNATFQVMSESGLTYDASWPSTTDLNPALWPYTLDYASTQDCPNPPCPTASFPGKWVLPLASWEDPEGNPCHLADSCPSPPDLYNSNAWFEYMVSNFERHYTSNRAPFGMHFREWFLSAFPGPQMALPRFLNLLNGLPDVFMVNAGEVIDWIKNPVPINEYSSKPCRAQAAECPVNSCGPLKADHTYEQFWLQACNECPNVFPWLGNPLGK